MPKLISRVLALAVAAIVRRSGVRNGNGDLVPVGAGRAGPRGARANRSNRVDTAFPLSTTLCLSRGALVS